MYPGPIRNQAFDILFLFEATAVAFIQVMLPRYPGGKENAPLLSHGHENGSSEKIREKSSPIHQWKRGWRLAEHFENYSPLSHCHKNGVFSNYAEITVFCQGGILQMSVEKICGFNNHLPAVGRILFAGIVPPTAQWTQTRCLVRVFRKVLS